MMDNRSKSLNRRSLLKMGLGVAGAAVALKTGALPAQASSAPSRVQDTLPILAEPDSALFNQIQQAMGNTTGTVSNHILTIDLPRTDQALAMFGTSLSPDMMADTEISFAKVNGQVACKWEMCLLDAEVNGVLTALVNAKLLPAAESFSALHNHYLLEMPRIKFMHGFAYGDGVQIATILYNALKNNSATPFGHGAEPPGTPGFDANQVTQTIGGKGHLSNGVLTVTVDRQENIQQRGIALPSGLQFQSNFHFQTVSDHQAEILEFVVTNAEADKVASKLFKSGFTITALHNHELDVSPNFYYLHAYRSGNALTMATDTRSALNLTNSNFS